MLLLPTGQVLFAAGTPEICVYTPSGSPNPAWRPQITAYPHNLAVYGFYSLYGLQLNGLSQAVSYGDDASAATNYPLVCITQADGTVVYCRTFLHSTMGVATGAFPQNTFFAVPSKGVRQGSAELCVIANGIASPSVPVFISTFISVSYISYRWRWLVHHWPRNPGDPPVAPHIREAFNLIRRGLKTLSDLGDETRTLQVTPKDKSLTRKGQSPRRAKPDVEGKMTLSRPAKSSPKRKASKKKSGRKTE